MGAQQNLFIIFFLIISFILWQIWNTENHQNTAINTNIPHHQVTNNIIYNETSNKNYINNNDCTITVKTDVFFLKINTYGGDIEEAYLINYLDNLKSKKPFHLLNISQEFSYKTNSGWTYVEPSLTKQTKSNNSTNLLYTTPNHKNIYILPKNKNTLKVTLTHQFNNGVEYTKSYVFQRNNYAIHVLHNINNNNKSPINIKLFGNLIQTISIPKLSEINPNDHDNFPLYSYRGTAYSTDKLKYKKYSFKNIQNSNLDIQSTGGWIAMLQKYFVTAWLPLTPKKNTFYTTCTNNNQAIIGFQSNEIQIKSGQQKEFQSILWIGPKIQETMKQIESNLDLVIDYGWLWFIAQPLFKLLNFTYYYVNNWGISIITITLIIRLIMYPLTKAQYTSMAKIRMLQPKLSLIQKEYKHNKHQYHKKIIELYKSEQVNPLGGCLPIFIQMPIFLALYYMLSGSVELRHAPFTLWIQDLSAQDPYYILPILMGGSMFFLQKMSPSTITDSMQKKIMTIMLIIFTIFFLWFPAGLVLYYIVSNIITIIQQQIIYHGLEKKGLYTKK